MDIEDEDIYDDDVNIDNTYLTFTVNKEEYAIFVTNVIEIIKLQKIIPVPDVSNYISGVINLRGRVIPVMDIRKRFNLPELEYSERTVIIVIEHENVLTGITVDKVNDVLEIPVINIENNPHYTNNDSLVKGIVRTEDKTLVVIDIGSLLNINKKILIESK